MKPFYLIHPSIFRSVSAKRCIHAQVRLKHHFGHRGGWCWTVLLEHNFNRALEERTGLEWHEAPNPSYLLCCATGHRWIWQQWSKPLLYILGPTECCATAIHTHTEKFLGKYDTAFPFFGYFCLRQCLNSSNSNTDEIGPSGIPTSPVCSDMNELGPGSFNSRPNSSSQSSTALRKCQSRLCWLWGQEGRSFCDSSNRRTVYVPGLQQSGAV